MVDLQGFIARLCYSPGDRGWARGARRFQFLPPFVELLDQREGPAFQIHKVTACQMASQLERFFIPPPPFPVPLHPGDHELLLSPQVCRPELRQDKLLFVSTTTCSKGST